MNHLNRLIFVLMLSSLIYSCKGLKQNVLFATDEAINADKFKLSLEQTISTYKIQPLDRIAISVFTNDGERLIDPNKEFEIGKELPPDLNTPGSNSQTNQIAMQEYTNGKENFSISANNSTPTSYLVNEKGFVQLPLIGNIELEGKTLEEANNLLAKNYEKFYEKPFVVTQYLNKRVVLMGALGDRVLPIRNENMTLTEVLALAGDVQLKAKPDKIRLIRGPWDNPSVKLIDLSTIASFKDANVIIEPNDIIYVESRRKLNPELVQDINAIITPIATLTTLALTLLLFVRELDK
ncbi:polysaccharide biosynthesis/export family protein [Flexithrix dorotheae]|uniref:polysaccharide biosynthesis/export family protein n=1 Tax=Flexithrix dorotheae TaxID=70993 RepID=UPI0009FDD4BF|nr:polysaccharide biosynthesis/export family protein [Flexithrix dorotheae]